MLKARIEKIKINYTLIFAVLFSSFGILSSQEQIDEDASTKLKQGIDLFYMAKFESALNLLQESVNSEILENSEKFDAYLYIGFSLIRLNQDPQLIDDTFLKAVNADPKRILDHLKFPPDLVKRFENVRANTLGGLYINSTPADATSLLVNEDYNSKLLGITPYTYENVLIGEYELLITKKSFKDKVIDITIYPGKIDTINVDLVEKTTPIYKAWWAWGGSIVIATTVAILASSRDETPPSENSDLPGPPQRPKP